MGMTSDDRREQERRRYGLTSGSILNVSQRLAIQAAKQKRQEIDIYSELDPYEDFMWGNYYGENTHPFSYFDYYFTGQDVVISIEGTASSSAADAGVSPFMMCSFSIQQEKTPVYGFWSYTYDAVMRGTRIVSGAFRILTTYPNRMTDLLSEAATTRKTNRGSLQPIRGLDTDESNIEKYWDRNIEQRDAAQPKKIFSIHPPFNLQIMYGIQSTSVRSVDDSRANSMINLFKTGPARYTDTNERLVDTTNIGHGTTILLTNVELTSMQTEFSIDGTVCSEVYSFFAKDIITPSR